MNEWIGFALTAGLVSVISSVFILGAMRRTRETAQRLQSNTANDSNPDMYLGPLTPAFAGQIPAGERDEREIRPELVRAGYYRPTALLEYQAIRAVLILLPLFLAGVICLFIDPSRIPIVGFVGICLSILGYGIPRVYLNLKVKARIREIERGLPIAVDMLTLGLIAGQNVLSAFRRVALEIRHSHPVLSQEMEIVSKQAELDTLAHAMDQWADRSGVNEVRNLSVIISQSERLGTDISNTLLEFAANFRTTLRQRVDAQAARAGFWMVLPTLLCFWIPSAVILAGPVFYEFFDRRAKTRDILQKKDTPETREIYDLIYNPKNKKQSKDKSPGK